MKINELVEKNKESFCKRLLEIATNQKKNIANILLVASFLGSGNIYAEGDEKSKDNKTNEVKKNEITNNEITTNDSKIKENLIYELFTNRTLPDLSEKGKELQKKREGNYLGINEAWNERFDGNLHRKRLIGGFSRMIEKGHLEMIINKLKENNVPIEMLFLAIAESYWEPDIVSPANAKGLWQFIETSAKMFGAIDENGNDFRGDPEISTDAAIRHLKANYDMVSLRAKSNNISTREEDKWMFAMYLYNGGPKLIKKAFIESNGNANIYAEKQRSIENINYVPRILAIRNVLYELGKKYDFDILSMEYHRLFECCNRKTETDYMFEEYYKIKEYLDYLDQVKQITKVMEQLKIDYEQGLLSDDKFQRIESELKNELLCLQEPVEEN